ncbi:16S rRNA (guanine(966)-N(2))-methyltransferase RsmD [Alphaproteobacteria bacterium KMM 3653]|uniref:16S rRNA (Guanine(966)-N(2))-methyltransferase RsmD n=1 Tax=Harenicola maris TaxID=2841044 RepID=A0AAP2G7Y4_9RHOB|nr:16S rRNA (guanine(966)-N(2))-methyltransferase RsmD [Harenicola maris]
MRIVGGNYRGLRLTDLGKGDPAAHLRPTSDRVRENLFNMLNSRMNFAGLHVLDLFAGTGALGLEALSRGAKHATFVDDGAKAQGLIRANIALCKPAPETQLLKTSALRLPAADTPCDLVFADPPYGKALGDKALTQALKTGWIAPQAWIVLEENAPLPPPKGFTLEDQRRYGDTWITLMRAP